MNRIIPTLLQSGSGDIIPIRPAQPRGPQGEHASTPRQDEMSADSRQLFAAWQRWRGDRLLPHRADMDLVAISRLMPRLVVLDVHAPEQITFRLAGTEIEQQYGQRLTGRSYVRMVPPERQQRRGELIWHIATQPCAVLQHAATDWQSGRHGMLEMFGLPVLPDRAGEPVQMLGVVSRLPPQTWGQADGISGMRSVLLQPIDIGAGLPAAFPVLCG